MKKITLPITVLLSLLFFACDKESDLNEKESIGFNYKNQSLMIEYVQSMHLDNGVNCTNNILIFPTWDHYEETIEKLDEMTDNYCDVFDATVPSNISDDDYDALAEEAGFDEDDIIKQFEQELEFCSLREKIAGEEEAWLELQGDGPWNINDDPDNHFIDDETERALLSVNAEVIIGDLERGYTYYKFLDDKGGMIIIHNWDMQAIIQVSSGGPVPTDNPNVEVITEREAETPPPGACKTELKEIDYVLNGVNRIKRKSKVRNNDPWSAKKIASVTVGYKKKRGKWKRRRTWITAGITGTLENTNATYLQDCSIPLETHKYKHKRRRKVKVKFRTHTYSGGPASVQIKEDKCFSVHNQGSINFSKDYYDMSSL